MIRVVRRADDFWADLLKQVDWYREKAGSQVAEGYVNAIEATLQTLMAERVIHGARDLPRHLRKPVGEDQ